MGLFVGKIKQSDIINYQGVFNKSSVIKRKNDKIDCTITGNSIIIANEKLAILKILHSLLLTNSNLTNKQKLDYCKSERFYMKSYLREIITNLNSRDFEINSNLIQTKIQF